MSFSLHIGRHWRGASDVRRWTTHFTADRKNGFCQGAFISQTWKHPQLGTFKLSNERDPSWVYRFLAWVTSLPPFQPR